jgi:hypothetical protein
MDVYAQHRGGTPSAFRFTFDGWLIYETHTPDDLEMKPYVKENETYVMMAMLEQVGGCVAAPVPAVFGAHHGSAGVRFLRSAEAAATASPTEVNALIKALEQPYARGAVYQHPKSYPNCKLLDSTAMRALMRHIDEHRLTQQVGAAETDFRLTLGEDELRACVGAAATRQLFDLFGRTPSVIKLRRVEATSDSDGSAAGDCVAFHTDRSTQTAAEVGLRGAVLSTAEGVAASVAAPAVAEPDTSWLDEIHCLEARNDGDDAWRSLPCLYSDHLFWHAEGLRSSHLSGGRKVQPQPLTAVTSCSSTVRVLAPPLPCRSVVSSRRLNLDVEAVARSGEK